MYVCGYSEAQSEHFLYILLNQDYCIVDGIMEGFATANIELSINERRRRQRMSDENLKIHSLANAKKFFKKFCISPMEVISTTLRTQTTTGRDSR